MIKPLKMPNLGTTTDQMHIVRWMKAVGDHIDRGEAIYEVETDKATMEVESYAEGYLKKVVKGEGDTALVGETIAYIGGENDVLEDNEAADDKANKAEESQEMPKAAEKSPEGMRVSPMIKALAARENVDIKTVRGSGPKGLIMRRDIIEAREKSPAPSAEAAATAVPPAGVTQFTRVERATAAAMAQSKATIPHVYFSIDVDATAMKRMHMQTRLSYNAMLVCKTAELLGKYPYLACTYQDGGRILPGEINIGLAMAKGDELFVPVIRKPSGFASVDIDISRLRTAMDEAGFKQSDLQGGVFTITNLGAFGLTSFTAVIRPPEVAILAVGGFRDTVVPMEGGFLSKPLVQLTLSVDHRVVNGAYAAAFLRDLKEQLERI